MSLYHHKVKQSVQLESPPEAARTVLALLLQALWEIFKCSELMTELSINTKLAQIPLRGLVSPWIHRLRTGPQNLPQKVQLNLAGAELQTALSHQQQCGECGLIFTVFTHSARVSLLIWREHVDLSVPSIFTLSSWHKSGPQNKVSLVLSLKNALQIHEVWVTLRKRSANFTTIHHLNDSVSIPVLSGAPHPVKPQSKLLEPSELTQFKLEASRQKWGLFSGREFHASQTIMLEIKL